MLRDKKSELAVVYLEAAGLVIAGIMDQKLPPRVE